MRNMHKYAMFMHKYAPNLNVHKYATKKYATYMQI